MRNTPELGYNVDMPHASTLAPLAELAEDQWGLLTRRQAVLAGIPRNTLGRMTADGSVLERVTHGVYRLVGAPPADHLGLRAAWLALAPDVLAWERTAGQGVVSHRSAASLWGVGELPADRHEFTVAKGVQTRRKDVRLHHRQLREGEWITVAGLPVTMPARIASDLLSEHEDPEAVARLVVDAMRHVNDYPGSFADSLAPHAARFGLRRHDGLALLRWMLDLAGHPETDRWMTEARAHVERERQPGPRRSEHEPSNGSRAAAV
jgi:hypothetical protein